MQNTGFTVTAITHTHIIDTFLCQCSRLFFLLFCPGLRLTPGVLALEEAAQWLKDLSGDNL